MSKDSLSPSCASGQADNGVAGLNLSDALLLVGPRLHLSSAPETSPAPDIEAGIIVITNVMSLPILGIWFEAYGDFAL